MKMPMFRIGSLARRTAYCGSVIACAMAASGHGLSEAEAAEQLAQTFCYDTNGSSGLNLDQVVFSRDNVQAGTFRMARGTDKWTEEGPGYPGTVRFHYRETARDACKVQIFDSSRNVAIDFDMGTRTVFYSDRSSTAPQIFGRMDSTAHGANHSVWQRGGGTAYGNPPGTDESWPPGPTQQQAAPQAEPEKVNVPVVNGTAQPLDVVWLEPGGGQQQIMTVPPGETWSVITTVGHEFLLISGGQVLSQQTVSGQFGQQFVVQ